MKFIEKIIDRFQLLLIVITTVLAAVLGVVLLPLGQNKALHISSLLWSRTIFAFCGVKLKVYSPYSRDYFQDKKFIFVSNHESNADIPALFLSIPQGLFFIAKEELKKIPFMGWYMWLVGMIFIDRTNSEKAKQSMLQAGEAVKKGKNILSFPEGTRSRTGEISAFKRGTFHLSLKSGIPVFPIGIYGTRSCMPADTFEIRPGTIYVTLGKPVDPSNWSDDHIDEYASFVKSCVEELKEHSRKKAEAARR